MIFGDDQTMDQKVWTEPRPPLAKLVQAAGITETAPLSGLADELQKARRQQRPIHFLPFYRPENLIRMSQHGSLLLKKSKLIP